MTGASPATTPAAGVEQRMLALIIPVGNQAWFIKAMGATERVAAIEADFGSFRDSIRFETDSSPPQWTLPSGWTQSAGNQFRYATIDAAGVDLSVSSLPMSNAQSQDEYVLSNVNRWRGQLQLAPLTVEELAGATQQLPVSGRSAIAVDLLGQATGGSPPMMSGNNRTMPGGAATNATTAASAPATSGEAPRGSSREATGDAGPTYAVPDGWQPGRTGPFRLVAFQVEKDGATAEVTVSALGPSAGSLLDNVNRWRGQIALPTIDDSELAAAIQPIRVADTDSQWIELTGEPASTDNSSAAQAILVVVIPQANQTVFIKMLGERNLVIAEKEHFRSFAESLRLPAAKSP